MNPIVLLLLAAGGGAAWLAARKNLAGPVAPGADGKGAVAARDGVVPYAPDLLVAAKLLGGDWAVAKNAWDGPIAVYSDPSDTAPAMYEIPKGLKLMVNRSNITGDYITVWGRGPTGIEGEIGFVDLRLLADA